MTLAPGRMRAAVLLAESARVTDSLSGARALLHEDSAQAVEQVSHTIGVALEDGASAAETIQGARTSRATAEDAVRITDDAVHRVRESGEPMLFLSLSDKSGIADAILWPSAYRKYHAVATGGGVLAVRGKVTENDDTYALEAEHLEEVKP